MDVFRTDRIRNVVLLSAMGCWKNKSGRGNGLFIRYYKPLGESDRWKHRQ